MSHQPVAVVFGAAGGIGRSAVECFVERGCRVVAVDPRTPRNLPEGVAYLAHSVDRQDHRAFSEIQEAVDAPISHVTIATGGASPEEVRLDQAVLAPGSDDLLNASLAANVAEVVAITNGMLALLTSDGSASLTIVSSINASGDFGYPYYSTAKAAVEGFVRSSARSLGSRGIRINAISFGTVLTERSIELHHSDPEHYTQLTRLAATRRLTTVREAGVAVTVLALDLTNVAGAVLVCDGGQSIPGRHSIA